MDPVILLGTASGITLLYLATGLFIRRASVPVRKALRNPPDVTVLIAMRNEEEHIGHCLEAFRNQNYPSGNYRVLVIDDQSQDRSADIVHSFMETNPHFGMLTITGEKYGLRGKMNALAQGMEQADSGIILITDADCIVPSDWIRTFASYFDESVGMVGGLTLLYPLPDRSVPVAKFGLFARVQALDWAFLQIVASYSSHTGKPTAVLGNNFGFRREVYDEVGGFKKIGFSVTEDFALMQAVKRTKRWKILHALDPGNTIFSYPVSSLGAFFRQRQRWVAGGKGADVWMHFMLIQTVLLHAALIAVLFVPGSIIWKAALWGIVFGFDYSLISPVLNRLRLHRLKPYFFLFEVFYFIYSILFAITALLPLKVRWKGRVYK